ncbi:MAG: Amidinotransferase family protein [uncultured bacterium]|nr:MAG: Amidinotransferase family protein [uncultured bacterium]
MLSHLNNAGNYNVISLRCASVLIIGINHMKILMCRPDYYEIKYEINPWMDMHKNANQQTVMTQWETLYQIIKKCGAEVDLVDQIPGWPDMTFAANAGMMYEGKVVLSHFKFKERQGEVAYFKDWFIKAGFEILNPFYENEPFFEGAGDALSADDKIFAGFGFRSEKKFYEQAAYLDKNKLIYCELVDPHFYHIDTCYCPLTDKLGIWYPGAFSKESQKKMTEQMELIPVIENEAKRFACNAIVLDKHIILASDCPQITSELEKRGFIVHPCDMDEFIKAGGACKCLTLRLD